MVRGKKFMKKLTLVLFILAMASSLAAQEYIDVVYLKNGGRIRGIIIENIPNEKVKIQTSDGSIFVYKYEEIEKFTREESQKTVKPEKSEKSEKKGDMQSNKILYEELEKSQALGCLITAFVPGGQHFYAKEYLTGAVYVGLFIGAYIPLITYSDKFVEADDRYKKTGSSSDKKKADKYGNYAAYSLLALVGVKIVDVLHGFYSIDNYNDNLKKKFNLTSNQNKIHMSANAGYDDIYKERRYNVGLVMTF